MKQRQGFVSNSSSSSFVLGVARNLRHPKIKLTLELDLEAIQEFRISSVEALKAELMEYYGCESDIPEEWGTYERELFEKCRAAIENGHDIMWITVSNDDFDNPVSQMIHSNPDTLRTAMGDDGKMFLISGAY